MSTIDANNTYAEHSLRAEPQRTTWFLHPLLDYLLIGGGLSLLVIPCVLLWPQLTPTDRLTTLMCFLVFNYAHFAASTVRLYSKPECRETFWFLCYGFPIVAVLVTTMAILWPDHIGKHLWSLMLTWSPYHYAAQAYGLAVIYAFRAGVRLSSTDKSLLWWVSMLPFFRAFLNAPEAGLAWFVREEWLIAHPLIDQLRYGAVLTASALIFLLAFWIYRRAQLPLISLLILLVNGIWWVTLSYTEAWFWATIFHSVQYLAIVMIYHVKDCKATESPGRGVTYHALSFYIFSFLLGYTLFIGLPVVYGLTGLAGEQTALMIAATINIHHFVVDGYIWRSRRRSSTTQKSLATRC